MQPICVSSKNFDKQHLLKVVDLLNAGSPIVLPTETVYGIACAMDESAFMNLYFIKNRELSKPLAVLVENQSQALGLSCDVPSIFWKLTEKYWPGPLTIVLKKRPELNYSCLAPDTIALRCSSHPILQQIINEFGKPLFLSSANLSGTGDDKSFDNIFANLFKLVPFFIDDGNLVEAIPSTIVSIFDNKIKILRAGAVSSEELEKNI